ncbi:uncharacterized protein LOC135823326 [Sycon ciliatum]|uniref:uncharacterized protein LOC135823326 n=1 Tax=Sycon ciliatum TaxID=27933 RepID=UPI0031F650B6
MFASKLHGNLKTVSKFVQRGYAVSVQSRLVQSTSGSRLCVTSKVTQTSAQSRQSVRWRSDQSGRQVTTVHDAVDAIRSIFDSIVKSRTFQPSYLLSQCSLIQRHVTELRYPSRIKDILQACALVNEENTDVTTLAVSALNQLASLPTEIWQESKNQHNLIWAVYWAAKCRCSTPGFTKLLQQQLDVMCIEECRAVDQCAHALFMLNMPDRHLAQHLMNRYLTIQSTGDPKHRHTEVLRLLLYCTLCGLECSALLELISVDQLIQSTGCGPRHVQLLLLHNTLPGTNDLRLQILETCLVRFRKAVASRYSGRMHDMLSYFIGSKYTTGISLVDGLRVQAFCIFDRDYEPVETDAYPADVYNGVSVDMTAARRHGFSVVACKGVSDIQLLRHPVRAPDGYDTLEALALKSQGCYSDGTQTWRSVLAEKQTLYSGFADQLSASHWRVQRPVAGQAVMNIHTDVILNTMVPRNSRILCRIVQEVCDNIMGDWNMVSIF